LAGNPIQLKANYNFFFLSFKTY